MEVNILQTKFVPPIKHVNPDNPWLPLLTPHQLVEINSAFKKFDRDGDGHIEPKEIQKVMSNLGMNLTQAQVTKLIAAVDTDGNGMIEFDEFIYIMAERMLKHQSDDTSEIDQAFSFFNDGSGTVSAAEIRDKLTTMGSLRLTNAEVDGLLAHLGTPDSNGRYTWAEFSEANCWMAPQPPGNRKRGARGGSSAVAGASGGVAGHVMERAPPLLG